MQDPIQRTSSTGQKSSIQRNIHDRLLSNPQSQSATKQKPKESSNNQFMLSPLIIIVSLIVFFIISISIEQYIKKMKKKRAKYELTLKDFIKDVPTWQHPPSSLRLLQAQILPKTYDPRDKLSPVKDQGQCGSCYLHSLIGVLSDKYSLKMNKRVDLSQMYVLDCIYSCKYGADPCNPIAPVVPKDPGAINPLQDVIDYLSDTSDSSNKCTAHRGVVTQSCYPGYVSAFQYFADKKNMLIIIYSIFFVIACILFILPYVLPYILKKNYGLIGSQSIRHQPWSDKIEFMKRGLLILFYLSIFIFILLSEVKENTTPTNKIIVGFQCAFLLLLLLWELYLCFRYWRVDIIEKKYDVFPSVLLMTMIFISIIVWLSNGTNEHTSLLFSKKCPKKCVNNEPMIHYYTGNYWKIPNDINTMKQYIYTQGSIVVDIDIPLDYEHCNKMMSDNPYIPDDAEGQTHAMAIIGWRDDAWIIRNSWGTDWKNKGYIYWKMGTGIIRELFSVDASTSSGSGHVEVHEYTTEPPQDEIAIS